MFQPIFNFLPYRLAAPPFDFSTGMITLTYFVYALGFFLGPLAGNLSNRIGSGNILETFARLPRFSCAESAPSVISFSFL